MTRWGILSDIHGNLPALERALAELRERGAERIAVLGDTLGRGDSAGCVRLIRAIADVSVLGNRDLDWQDRVDAETKAYVLGLPRVMVADSIAFSHGDARLTRDLSTDEIRSGFRRASAWLSAHACRAWIFGHSHHARVWAIEGSLHFDVVRDGLPATVRLETAESDGSGVTRTAINAGSVGLPFPGKGPASALLYDAEAGGVEMFPV